MDMENAKIVNPLNLSYSDAAIKRCSEIFVDLFNAFAVSKTATEFTQRMNRIFTSNYDVQNYFKLEVLTVHKDLKPAYQQFNLWQTETQLVDEKVIITVTLKP